MASPLVPEVYIVLAVATSWKTQVYQSRPHTSRHVQLMRKYKQMWRILLFLCLPLLGFSADRWIQFTSGPFEVFTDAGASEGRETLMRFEQFRNALGLMIGETDLKSRLPIRILLFKDANDAASWRTSSPIVEGRDRFLIPLISKESVRPTVFHDATRLFLESNVARLPASFDRGVETLFSTIEVTGIRVTLGSPVPPGQRNREWALVHMLATSPDYYGKLRVLLYNLRKGVDPDAAYLNAVGKTPGQIEKEAGRYLAAGHFQSIQVPSRALSVRDFPEKAVEPADVRLALADLLVGDQSRAAYQAMIHDNVHVAQAWEGLGMLALRDKQNDAARTDFVEAMNAGSQSAMAYLEYARLEPDNTKALTALRKAVSLNPKLAETHYLMAERESDPAKRIEDLKAATTLNPRDADYWQALAEASLAARNFSDAAKAWTGAEQASTTDEQRAKFRIARLAIEKQRLDYEAAERKRVEEEKQRELEKLKEQARAHLHEIEERANRGESTDKPGEKVVPWWDGPKPSGRVTGTLKRLDCLGKAARLVLETDDQKLLKLHITDPTRITILNGGEQTLGCGPQKPRRVTVEYFPKSNQKLATVGEVATIRFE